MGDPKSRHIPISFDRAFASSIAYPHRKTLPAVRGITLWEPEAYGKYQHLDTVRATRRPLTVIYIISVYRHRGKFFAIYNPRDSYPAGLGVEMVESIPRDPSTYATWLEETRAKYDRLGDETSERPGTESDDLQIHETRPTTDLFVEYVYEIDLDDEVFWMNAMPMFRLDRMPSPEVFLEVRGRDSYGQYVPKASMPAEHACQIATPSQAPSEEDLSSYTSFLKHAPAPSPLAADVCALLGVSEEPSAGEHVRIALYEVITGGLMAITDFKTVLLNSQLARAPLTHQPWIAQTAKKLVVRAFVPMVFHSDVELSVEDRVAELEDESGAGGLLWLTSDVCFGVGFHLDYDDHLRASIGKMVRDIRETSPAKGIVYGVLCSVFHIVIVKVDTAPGGSFEHTSALQFLPSRFAESPSTPGITALLRLAFREDSTLCETVLSKSPFKSEPQAASPTYVDRLQPELVARVASFIPDLRSLLSFATLSDNTKAQVSPEFRFPFIGHHHLLEAFVKEDQSLRQRLRSRSFVTRDDDGDTKVCQINGARLVRMPWEDSLEVKGCFGMFSHDTKKAKYVLQVEERKA
ncbi:hypothetical protein CCMSSC00406_0009651 [Pleurotus cornucopiae]|uniref:Uncharacterized protein n=1 Tax=Pleurotus cornucopiae TaxID=5321 RepID=A0ACB7JAK4_PLECO|nr:hypothetical protein CCMSSC00406_0009651 [Pleurotus cornucopiae]